MNKQVQHGIMVLKVVVLPKLSITGVGELWSCYRLATFQEFSKLLFLSNTYNRYSFKKESMPVQCDGKSSC